jgi:hypothetical protein
MRLRATERTEIYINKGNTSFPAFLCVLQENLPGVYKSAMHKRVHREKYKHKVIVFHNQKVSLCPLWLIALFGLRRRTSIQVIT